MNLTGFAAPRYLKCAAIRANTMTVGPIVCPPTAFGLSRNFQPEIGMKRVPPGIPFLLVLLWCDNRIAVTEPRDPTLDVLLDLDGQVLVVDPEGGHRVRFVVTRVRASPEKPHAIDYSLTLHGRMANGWSALDNAHPAVRQKRGEPQDHRHTPAKPGHQRTIRPYKYRDAATLVADFWTTVDPVLRERGVIP